MTNLRHLNRYVNFGVKLEPILALVDPALPGKEEKKKKNIATLSNHHILGVPDARLRWMFSTG